MIQVVGAVLIFFALGMCLGITLGRSLEQERMVRVGFRRLRESNIHVNVGGYEAGPRLVSDLRIPSPGPGPGARR